MSQIGSTEALEAYLKLERENKALSLELDMCKEELTKMKNAYSNLSTDVNTLFGWLEQFQNRTNFVRRKMAAIFKFAYMEAEFGDMRAKWPNQEAARMVAKSEGKQE
jgi:hypothetical protein